MSTALKLNLSTASNGEISAHLSELARGHTPGADLTREEAALMNYVGEIVAPNGQQYRFSNLSAAAGVMEAFVHSGKGLPLSLDEVKQLDSQAQQIPLIHLTPIFGRRLGMDCR